MRVIEVSFQRTNNLGNYESEKIEIKAEVHEGDNLDVVFAQLKEWVDEHSTFPKGARWQPPR